MTHLALVFSNFSGNVPMEISHLSKLVYLQLWRNERDIIRIGPATFKALAHNLTNLRELSLLNIDMSSVPLLSLTNLSSSLTSLHLEACHLHGKLPENVFRLPKLEVLNLFFNGNYLTGSFPKSNWSSLLRELDLKFNSFSGQIPWSTFNLNRLRSLVLSQNSFNGTLPSWIFALPYLTELRLDNNLFTGEIGEFQSLNLVSLDLSLNNFTGHLDLGNISELKDLMTLDLSFNNLSLTFNNCINCTLDNLQYLGLSSCNISEFPSFFRYSKGLNGLDLSRNQIKGSVPKWLWEVSRDSLLSLNLSHNLLTNIEPLPWNNLEVLDVRSNLFSGPLPISSSPALRVLLASKNQFTGEIPTSFCNMTSLWVLDLAHNNLSGNIPSCFGNFTSIEVLDFRMNNFHGRISLPFAKGNSLTTLNLNGNQFEGSLPRSLLNCEKLEVLDVGSNKINGSFPQWLESLPELQVLILRSNRFYGSIRNPKIRFPFRKLKIMDVSKNEFEGPLPTKYFENFVAMVDAHADQLEYIGSTDYYQDSVTVVMKGSEYQLEKILTTLTTIDVSRNNFEGEIPTSIGKLKSLKALNLSHNKLVGLIPRSLRNLSNLEGLDLSSNELSGEIPNELAVGLIQLAFLNLSLNKLVGPIPRGQQFETFGNDSYIGNLGLCGFPLSKTCSNTEGPQRPSPANSKHDDDGFGWKIVLMGFGSGMVIGISMGYMVIPDKAIEWLAEVVRVHWIKKRSSKRNGRQVRRIRRRN